jgi:hypothetical protein
MWMTDAAVAVEAAVARDDFRIAGLYPDPLRAGDRLTLLVDNPASAAVDLDVYDAAGRLVLRRHGVTIAAGRRQLTVSLPRLSPGLFFCRMAWEGRSEIRKFLLVR